MKTNSRSIYGTSKGITDVSTYGFMTVKDNSVFIHVLYWPDKEIRIQGIKSKVTSARYLHNDGSINFIQSDEHIILKDIPVGAPDPLCTVIELTMAEKPVSYPWAKDVLWKGDPTLMVDWAQKGVIE